MDMKKYIEMGEKAAGSQQELAEYLGQFASAIGRVKRGAAGLPIPLCVKLADLIGEPRLEVIAASDLVTEKNAERRKILESCFSKAAGVLLLAGATLIVTPSPAQAAPMLENSANTLYIMLNWKRKVMTMARKILAVFDEILDAVLPSQKRLKRKDQYKL